MASSPTTITVKHETPTPEIVQKSQKKQRKSNIKIIEDEVNITAKDKQRQFPPGKKYPYHTFQFDRTKKNMPAYLVAMGKGKNGELSPIYDIVYGLGKANSYRCSGWTMQGPPGKNKKATRKNINTLKQMLAIDQDQREQEEHKVFHAAGLCTCDCE